MKKTFFLIFTTFSVVANANILPTLGEYGDNTELYACSVTSTKNLYPSNGKAKLYTTNCRLVMDQNMMPNEKEVNEYAPPNPGFQDIEHYFFWYRNKDLKQSSEGLSQYCQMNIDYFKDCGWTEISDDYEISPEILDHASPELKNILNQPTPDLTSGNVYGCAVVLCLANPNGWASVGECKPPVHKLFRDLWKGKGFPSCSN